MWMYSMHLVAVNLGWFHINGNSKQQKISKIFYSEISIFFCSLFIVNNEGFLTMEIKKKTLIEKFFSRGKNNRFPQNNSTIKSKKNGIKLSQKMMWLWKKMLRCFGKKSWLFYVRKLRFLWTYMSKKSIREGANKRGNSFRLTQSFHFFMFEPIFSPVNVFANSTSKCDTRLCRLTVLFEYLDRLPESETFPRS